MVKTKWSRSSKAQKFLEEELKAGRNIKPTMKPKDVYDAHSIFNSDYTPQQFRTAWNRTKKEMGLGDKSSIPDGKIGDDEDDIDLDDDEDDYDGKWCKIIS